MGLATKGLTKLIILCYSGNIMPNRTIKIDDLLTVPAVAKQLQRPKMTIYRWANSGKITTIELGGVLFIPTAGLTCASCYHRTDTSLCACREPEDMITDPGRCPDWCPPKEF